MFSTECSVVYYWGFLMVRNVEGVEVSCRYVPIFAWMMGGRSDFTQMVPSQGVTNGVIPYMCVAVDEMG